MKHLGKKLKEGNNRGESKKKDRGDDRALDKDRGQYWNCRSAGNLFSKTTIHDTLDYRAIVATLEVACAYSKETVVLCEIQEHPFAIAIRLSLNLRAELKFWRSLLRSMLHASTEEETKPK